MCATTFRRTTLSRKKLPCFYRGKGKLTLPFSAELLQISAPHSPRQVALPTEAWRGVENCTRLAENSYVDLPGPLLQFCRNRPCSVRLSVIHLNVVAPEFEKCTGFEKIFMTLFEIKAVSLLRKANDATKPSRLKNFWGQFSPWQTKLERLFRQVQPTQSQQEI